MPKRVFWPIALIIMGLVFLASRMELLPAEFANLWPILLIIIGLGGLLTSDREEWLSDQGGGARRRGGAPKQPASRAPARVASRKPVAKTSRKR
jgi:hypothetical protein